MRGDYGQALGEYDPYVAAYEPAAGAHSDALGLSGPEGTARAQEAFQVSPGYQFQMDEGLEAMDRLAARRGMLASENTNLDTLRYAGGLADQEYDDYLDRLFATSEAGRDTARQRAGIQTDLGAREYGAGLDLGNLYAGTETGMGAADAQYELGKDATGANILGAALGGAKSLLALPTGGGLSLGARLLDWLMPYRQPDYSSFLFDAFSGVGDALNKERERQDRLALEQQDFALREQNYTRQLGLDEYQQKQDMQTNARRDRAMAMQEAKFAREGAEPYEVGNALVDRGTLKEVYRGPDPSINIQRDPPRWRLNPETGRQEAWPGGPMDPAVIAEQAKARGTGSRLRTLPQSAVNALSGAGESLTNVERVGSTFQDQYAGWGSPAVGQAANAVARYTGIGDEEAANWWQDYQRQKNIIRNQLFGSALTATEKMEFERADINPGMLPKIIKENLTRQHAAAQRAAQKLSGAYITQGYDPKVVEATTGIPLGQLGLGEQEPDAGGNVDVDAIMQEANRLISEGQPAEEVQRWLKEQHDIETEF